MLQRNEAGVGGSPVSLLKHGAILRMKSKTRQGIMVTFIRLIAKYEYCKVILRVH